MVKVVATSAANINSAATTMTTRRSKRCKLTASKVPTTKPATAFTVCMVPSATMS